MKNDKVGIIVLSILLVVVIVICFLATGHKKNNGIVSTGNSVVDQATKESQAVKKSEMKDFTDISVSEFSEFYSDSTNKAVLFSRAGCGYCQIAEPILKNIAYKYDLEIYRVDIDDMSEDDYNALKELNSDEFSSFGTPFLVAVSNNEIVNKVSGLTTKSSYIKFFKENGFINK